MAVKKLMQFRKLYTSWYFRGIAKLLLRFSQNYIAANNINIPTFTLLVFLGLFLLNGNVFAQRKVDMSQYSQAYFDSIRAQVYDTTNVYYTIQAYRLTPDDKIEIDGKLNEPAWEKAEHKTDFIEKDPYPLIPTSDETEFAILYDDENFYVGVWCWDSVPGKIVANLSPRGTCIRQNRQVRRRGRSRCRLPGRRHDDCHRRWPRAHWSSRPN